MAAHAKYSPSSASRWMNCYGSMRMQEGIKEETSVFAAEGTAAHELAAFCLNNGRNADEYAGYVIDVETTKIEQSRVDINGKTRFEVDEGMVEHVQFYLDYCRSLVDAEKDEFTLYIEEKLDLTHVEPKMFGTGDFILYRAKDKNLFVVDLKYGRGVVVEPEENAQALTYAVGAFKRLGNHDIQKVTIVIAQPRAFHVDGPIRIWETTPARVSNHHKLMVDDIAKTKEPDAPLTTGEWCGFCKAKAICPAMRERAIGAVHMDFEDVSGDMEKAVNALTLQQVADVLREANAIKKWCTAVEAHAQKEALLGNLPPGFKLVYGRKTRSFRDEKELVATLPMLYGVDKSEMYGAPKLKSPAQMEKLVGKAHSEALKAFIVDKQGRVLAPDEDPRKAIPTGAESDFVAVDVG